jgi:transposase-like protein/IS1 family transposase
LAAKGQVPTCHCCNGEAKKFGRFRNKNFTVQRYRCLRCGKSFSDKQPLDGLRVEFGQVCQVVNLLCESMGIRAVSRLTTLHRDTVLSILETVGAKCEAFLDQQIHNVKAEQVQVDEIHTFVNCKQMNNIDDSPHRGEFFTYLSVDRASKLIINWHTAKRNKENTLTFIRDLKHRVPERFQLTTDAFGSYWRGKGVVRKVFGSDIDYATEKKLFGRAEPMAAPWERPYTVIGIKRKARIGCPDMSMATTCHAERTNLSVRTFTRRFTRLTLGFSKKLVNLRLAVAMFVWHFNYCRKHSAHGKTPAMAAGLTDHVWTVEELLAKVD